LEAAENENGWSLNRSDSGEGKPQMVEAIGVQGEGESEKESCGSDTSQWWRNEI